jgi:regulator of protease activity HflC (stomatin/prohibitin superfamily)
LGKKIFYFIKLNVKLFVSIVKLSIFIYLLLNVKFMRQKALIVFTAIFAILLTSCTVIREGEVGVKRKLGKYDNNVYTSGLKSYFPVITVIEKVSIQTNNIEVAIIIPSKEGLSIRSEISILYSIIPSDAPDVLRTIGMNFERNVIVPIFRSAVADVTSRFYAKDMHSGERSTIEEAIKIQMMKNLEGRGILIEAVLMKSIQLPASLATAIEEKLAAEQEAQRMEFILQGEKKEAERKRIEAQGVRDAQLIIAEGLNPMILNFKAIEAFLELAKSPNAKVIITDGDFPMMLNPTDTEIIRPAPANPKR